MKRLVPDAADIAEAADILRKGGIVAYPTETVYGLAVNPFDEAALDRLFELKGRAENHPVLLIIAGMDQLSPLIAEVSPRAQCCMDKFWPGPLSLLLPAAPSLPPRIAPNSRVCVRWTADPTAQALCRAYGGAITSTSANQTGTPPARSIAELDLPDLDAALDGGTLPPAQPSTVYDPDTDEIIREGTINEKLLRGSL
ncbi:MAG: L-threonylcarbamoyladenylate synthase [Candidatus Hydrogenedentales bacterium]